MPTSPPILPKKPLKPLVKWSGGKQDELAEIQPWFPTDYKTLIEPFVGGGAVFFHAEFPHSVISDVHPELVSFYRMIQQGHATDIHDWMLATPNEEATYYRIRDEMVCETELDVAKRFYYLRKTCFRGMLRYNRQGKFNIPFGKYKTLNCSALLEPRYTELLKTATVLHCGFEEIFERYNSPENFVFLDPPYDSKFTDYGYCQFGEAHHVRLAELFKATKNRCVMVIGKTPLIERLYEGYIVHRFPKQYRFKIYGNRIGDEINNEHLVIRNF